MDAREAITALTKAGRRQEVEELLSKAIDSASASYSPIIEDESLSEKGRQQQLAASYLAHKASLDRKLQAMAATAVSSDRDDAERVFGVKGLPGDPASLSISHRDAGDRVAAITDPTELSALLKRATRSADEVLARAVAGRALEMQADKVLHQFIADRPDLDAAVERLWNAEQAVSDSMGVSMAMLGLRPAELGRKSTHQIEELAKPLPAQPAERTFAAANASGFISSPEDYTPGAWSGRGY